MTTNDERELAQRHYDLIAKKQVEAFMQQLELNYGLEPKEIHELFEDLRYLRSWRKNMGRYGDAAVKSALGAIVVAALVVAWEGIKHFTGK